MVYSITAKVHCECDGLNMWEDKDFNIKINPDLKDVIAYLFYKKYGKPYNELSWYLEDGAKEFVKGIEDSWNANTFDEFSLYHDHEFLGYLKKMYENEEVDEDDLEELLDDWKEDIEDELDGMTKADLQYLRDTEGQYLEYYAGSLRGDIDLDEYMEDHAWLWDDEEDEE